MTTRLHKTSATLIIGFVLLWQIPAFAKGDASLGMQLYLYGLNDNNTPITAIGAGGNPLNGRQDTCQSCHRRSGLGSSEGGTQIPAITGDILFHPRTRTDRELRKVRLKGPGARPAYTANTLKRAITQGIDVNGRMMHPLMPRFALSNTNLDNLIAYLKTLDSSYAPGVLPEQIIVATVFAPDANMAQRKAAFKTLDTFFRLHNNQTRGEKRRARHTPWHKSWEYTSYRDIHLLKWELTGPATSWQQQLEALYKKQPVYAIINGIGYDDWSPIHRFCEQQKLPCLFPTTDNPVVSNKDFYSIYFSAGVSLESHTLAGYILSTPGKQHRILQIYRGSRKARKAANILATRLRATGSKIDAISLTQHEQVKTALKRLPRDKQYDYLVLWLDDRDIARVTKLLNPGAYNKVVISSSFSRKPDLTPRLQHKTYMLSRFIAPGEHKNHLIRATMWARHYQIDLSNERVVSNAYFSATVFSKAVNSMRAYLSREHLIERFEHILERNVFHSVFPELQLGPDQRFASKGCYIVGPLASAQGPDAEIRRQWIVPNQMR